MTVRQKNPLSHVPLGAPAIAAVLCGLAAPAVAETTTADLQNEIAALRTEIAQMKAAQGDNWLNERRAEEVKGLIRDVLADADTRASLMQDGVLAGHDGKKFYLRSSDDSFLMNVEGQIQVRYVANFGEDREAVVDPGPPAVSEDDEWERGFQLRRTKLGFNGHIGSPQIGYDIVLATDRATGDVFLEDALVSYAFNDQWEVMAGRFKLPFLREELLSSKRQLAADRASVTEYFTLNRAEQIQLVYSSELFNVAAAFSDGANTESSEFNATGAEYALTGRVDVKLAGEWDQAKDFTAWEGDEGLGAFIGAAVHFEEPDDVNAFGAEDYVAYTVDALVEGYPWSVNAAFMGANGDDADAYGYLVQGGLHVTEQLEPFLRWDMTDVDGADEELQFVTAGFNYYLKKHAAKFTADVVWKYAGDNPGTIGTLNGGELSSGLGLDSSGVNDDDQQIALRAQFQLLF